MLGREISFGGALPRAVDLGLQGPVLYRRGNGYGALADRRNIAIRLAESSSDCDEAAIILNRMYGRRGYGSQHRVERTENSVTFNASSDGQMVGTLTLSVDSGARLAVDETFPEELRELRAEPGASLCELTKFAFNPAPDSRPLLAVLFHVIFLYGTQRFDCTDLLIEVNPRHVRFYEVMLRFSRVGPLRTNHKVGAPSQLMHLRVADIRTNIDLFLDCESPASHSLYRHFFDRTEEQGVKARIAAFVDRQSRPPALDVARHLARMPSVGLHRRRRPLDSSFRRKRAAA